MTVLSVFQKGDEVSQDKALIFEVSERNFNDLVLLNSYKLPVVVEFMGVYSGPCVALEQTLAAFAREFAGRFVFAKVDIDEQPALMAEYGVANLPTVKVFQDTQVVRTEEGQMQDHEVAAMLKSLDIYWPSDDLREAAREKHLAGDAVGAVQLLTQAIQMDPANSRVAMDMVQVMLDIGELEQAKGLFNRLPDRDKETDTGRALIGQMTFRDLAGQTEGKPALLARLEADPLDFDAYFDLAVCLVAEFDYQGGLESLFAIFEQQPDYKSGAAREMIVNLINMLTPNEPLLAKQYRQRLGNTVA